MSLRDVTKQVERGWEDEEIVQITKCICGATEPFVISIYESEARECPSCGCKFICQQQTLVYEVVQ
jgi:hypothetical protein